MTRTLTLAMKITAFNLGLVYTAVFPVNKP